MCPDHNITESGSNQELLPESLSGLGTLLPRIGLASLDSCRPFHGARLPSCLQVSRSPLLQAINTGTGLSCKLLACMSGLLCCSSLISTITPMQGLGSYSLLARSTNSWGKPAQEDTHHHPSLGA